MSRPLYAPEQPQRSTGPGKPLWWGGLIVAAGIAAYGSSLRAPFVFDDQLSIVENASIRHLATAWRTLHGQGLTVQGRPVLNVSLALNYAWGQLRVESYHGVNLAIHLLAGLTLWGILRRTLAPEKASVAGVAALLWTVHPLNTEAVTYTVQRAESLMGLFYLQTLYWFVRYSTAAAERGEASGRARRQPADRPGRPQAWQRGWKAQVSFALLCVISCALGMATKEDMVSAPLILFLYDRTFISGSFAAAWKARWRIYLALASTWAILLGLVLSQGGNRGGSVGFGTHLSWLSYWATQFPAVLRYLQLSVWPSPLVFDYGPFPTGNGLGHWPDAVVVAGLFVGTLWALRCRPRLGFLGAWFFCLLAPTSLLPGATQMLAEHRMYLPLIAVMVLLVVVACDLVPRADVGGGRRSRLIGPQVSARNRADAKALPKVAPSLVARFIGGGLAAALTVALVAATAHRNAVYGSELSLWQDTVAQRPHNVEARNNFGNALQRAGRVPEAIDQYAAGLRLEPGNAELHNNLGEALQRTGRSTEALVEFQAAVRAAPGFAEAHNNLGNAWAEFKAPAKAAEEFAAALRIRPRYAEAQNNLGLVLAESGRPTAAIAHYAEAVSIRPDYAEAHANLGDALAAAGKPQQAADEYRTALRLKPDLAITLNNLGNVLDELGRVPESIAAYRAALKLSPNNAEIRYNLEIELEHARRSGVTSGGPSLHSARGALP